MLAPALVRALARRTPRTRVRAFDGGPAAMGKEFINPNWHVILIHYPLGVFLLGVALEVALLVFRHHGPARAAARWMIVLGALLGLPAAYAGTYALSDVARRT